MERMFYCTETEHIYNLSDLEEWRQIAIADGDTFATETLCDFVNACLVENNGSLVELRITSTIRDKNGVIAIFSNIFSEL